MHRLKTSIRNWLALVLVAAVSFVAASAVPVSAAGEGTVEAMQQVALTEDQVKGYIKVGPRLSKLFDQIDKAGGEPDAKLQSELEAIAKDGGFKSFEDLEIIVSNITFVMSGLNEEDGSFTEPVDVLKSELAETEADKGLSADEKQQMIASIKESIASTPKLAHPGNVAIVRKHLKQLSSLFQE